MLLYLNGQFKFSAYCLPVDQQRVRTLPHREGLRMRAFSRYDAIYKAAVSEWEKTNNTSVDALANAMLLAGIDFIRVRPKHFSVEYFKITNSEEFRNSLLYSLRFSIETYIKNTSETCQHEKQKSSESWAYTSSLLLKMRDLYRQIPESRRNLINAHLEVQQSGQLADDLGATLMQARLVCSKRGAKRETRGRKTSPLTILVVALAENIEETFGRTLSRSYDTAPDDLFNNSAIAFTNHDMNLVYLLSRLLIPDATVEQVKAAMKNSLSRRNES